MAMARAGLTFADILDHIFLAWCYRRPSRAVDRPTLPKFPGIDHTVSRATEMIFDLAEASQTALERLTQRGAESYMNACSCSEIHKRAGLVAVCNSSEA